MLNKTYEATLGGPVMLDKLWFFSAGRFAKLTSSNSFPATGIKYDTTSDNKRGEVKITATPIANHTFQGNFTTNPTTETVPAIGGYEIDPGDARHAEHPQQRVRRELAGRARLEVLRRGGVLAAALLVPRTPAAPARRMADSPIFTLTQNGGGYEYNAPYFDATDPEDRNNRQLTANLSYSVNKAGRHDFKGGWEWYRSPRTGGNSQSATSYVFVSDFVEAPAAAPGSTPTAASSRRSCPATRRCSTGLRRAAPS